MNLNAWVENWKKWVANKWEKETYGISNQPDNISRCGKQANILAEQMIYISGQFRNWACDSEDYQWLLCYRSLYDKDTRSKGSSRAQISLLHGTPFQRSMMPTTSSLLRLRKIPQKYEIDWKQDERQKKRQKNRVYRRQPKLSNIHLNRHRCWCSPAL